MEVLCRYGVHCLDARPMWIADGVWMKTDCDWLEAEQPRRLDPSLAASSSGTASLVRTSPITLHHSPFFYFQPHLSDFDSTHPWSIQTIQLLP